MPEMWERYAKSGRKTKRAGWTKFARKHEAEIEKLRRPYRFDGWISLDNVRCPGCGRDGRLVGEKFAAPSRKDGKAWAELRILLENPGNFVHYFTKDKEAEKLEEHRRLRKKKQDAGNWAQEKQRRIEALRAAMKTGGRTSDEDAKLTTIYQRQEGDNWLFV